MQTRAHKLTPTPLPRRKSFRNFESEMEDYEPVEEEKEEDEFEESKDPESEPEISEPEIADIA